MVVLEQPGPGGQCDTCGHFALRHDEEGCHFPLEFRKSGKPCECKVMCWDGRDWPRPWLPAPAGLKVA